MRQVTIAIALIATLGSSQEALGAGDPTRGSTLYHTTYVCSDCHGASPTAQDNIVASGSTAAGILSAIQNVPEMRTRFLSTLGQNQTDLADIAAYLASIGGPVGPNLNQHGLTGSWYEPVTSGQGFEIEFFPNLIAPGTAFVQGAWFTFDSAPAGGAERQRWYTFSGNALSGAGNVPVTIYQNVGGNFAAPPMTSATVVGSGTLSFADCMTGLFTYAFSDGSGRSGSIPLTRITPNVTCSAGAAVAPNADFAFSGNWYDASTSGQGFVFEVNPLAPVFFVTWYTYAPAGQNAGPAGQRWLTVQAGFAPGARTIMATIYETTGGLFDQVSSPAPSTMPVGTATVTLMSCTTAQLKYAFTAGTDIGKSGTIALTRVGPVPPGCAM